MNDIILVSMETWGRVWRRTQNLAAGLARRYPQRKILFITLPLDLTNSVRRGHWRTVAQLAARGLQPAAPMRTAEFDNVFVFTPVKLFPHTLSAGRLGNQALARSQILAAAKKLQMQDPILYINPYYAAHMAGRMGESVLIYDVGEDWVEIEKRPWLRQQIQEEDDLLTARADAVIVVSPKLAQMKQSVARELHLVPNGVYAERYTQVCAKTLAPHPVAKDWKGPVLGHTGTLQSVRTDVDLLIKVARAFPQSTLALVGPDSLLPEDTRRLLAEPNIRLTGEVAYEEVPRVMSGFDVCLVPQQVNAFTESQNPLKMFEYLAAGLPIVSTAISGFRDYPTLVHLADNHEAFIAAIRAALVEPKEVAAERQKVALLHTWDVRIQTIVPVLESCLKRQHAVQGSVAQTHGSWPMLVEAAASKSPVTQTSTVVSVVVVSFNTRHLTLDCLRELTKNLGELSSEILVVDNGSTDGSADAITAKFPNVRLIANTDNAGFGAANNQAIAIARGEFILLLNTDAFAKPGAIDAMVNYLRAHPEAALVGPRLLNADQTLQRSCFRFPTPLRCWMENLWVYSLIRNHPKISDYNCWPHDSQRNVDFVIGACLLVRSEVIQKVGGFDPAFFMYSEEIDWQRRIRQAGWEVAFTNEAQVTHLGGASGANDKSRIKRHFFDSLDYYEIKHHGLGGLVAMRLAMVTGCSMRALLWTGMFLLRPRRREQAASKVWLHLWLCRRQLTQWYVQKADGNEVLAPADRTLRAASVSQAAS